MKYFVFSDAHGDYDALMRAIEEYGYQSNNIDHTLISCGDNFGRADRGLGSKGIYDYLNSHFHKNTPICLMGNHELILKDILFRRNISVNDIYNGEHKTIYSFLGRDLSSEDLSFYDINQLSRGRLMDWLLKRPYYFETKHYIFLHGFLPFDFENTKFITENLSGVSAELWKGACWARTPLMISRFAEDYPEGIGKTIVFGHWHNAFLREQFDSEFDRDNMDAIWKNEKLKLCGLDCCTYATKRVEMLVVED